MGRDHAQLSGSPLDHRRLIAWLKVLEGVWEAISFWWGEGMRTSRRSGGSTHT
jgi:hypothetical protein